MFPLIYIEEEVVSHPRVRALCQRFAHIPQVACRRYGEVFNRKNQNFRLQKGAPSLILAKKQGHFVLPTPTGYGIGAPRNFYFSHFLNCLFDCRYCFLQGMYASAHYVFFVNFEDFENALCEMYSAQKGGQCTFFSGYDCDSLAMEGVTGFATHFLPFFARLPDAEFELRTKSVAIQSLLRVAPLCNCVVAFSLTPRSIGELYEKKTPSLTKRLEAMQKLQAAGWAVGLRFDPLIYCENFRPLYQEFFKEVFQKLNANTIHSVSMGPFRLPPHVYKQMVSLYPEEPLFARSFQRDGNRVSYQKKIEKEMLGFCTEEVLKYIPFERFFPCV